MTDHVDSEPMRELVDGALRVANPEWRSGPFASTRSCDVCGKSINSGWSTNHIKDQPFVAGSALTRWLCSLRAASCR